MTDYPDEIRKLIESVDAVTDAEARARAELRSEPTGSSRSSRRRGIAYALAAASVALVVGATALVGLSRSEPDGVQTTGEGGPTPTVLPPVGDDPVVSCDSDFDADWFRVSAWSNPTGAENDGTPAAEVLRTYLLGQQMMADAGIDPLAPELPQSPWRLLSADETHVLWGAGDLDLERIAGDELGPLVSFLRADLVDGTWQTAGGGGGSCNTLYVQPPDGMSVARWGIAPADLPGPDATRLTLTIDTFLRCGDPVTAEEIAGPDVVETADAVTIRLAIDRPPADRDDMADCMRERAREGEADEPDPLEVDVDLAEPLGDRQVVDANQFPARAIDLAPVPEPETPAPTPRLELDGGVVDVSIEVFAARDDCEPPMCLAPVVGATVTVSAGDVAGSIETGEPGRIVAVVPEARIDVAVEAADIACAPLALDAARADPQLTVRCVRLERPHAAIEGSIGGTTPGASIVRFRRRDRSAEWVATVTEPDGSFSVTLEPGPWRIDATDIDGVARCTVGPLSTIEVVADEAQRLELTCD